MSRQDVTNDKAFDTKRFLEDRWPEPENLRAFLATYGKTIRVGTIVQWYRREQIPAEWLPVILGFLAAENGGRDVLGPYLR